MERSSLKARRMVYDHMISSKVPVANFVIKKELVQSCKAFHLKYTAHMEERRKQNTNQAGAKRKTLSQGGACYREKKEDGARNCSVVTSKGYREIFH